MSTTAPKASWRGPLRYCFSLALPASNFLALYSDAVVAASPVSFPGLQQLLGFSGVIFPFGLLPLLDVIAGRDVKDPLPGVGSDWRYRLPVYLYVPVHLLLLFCCCRRAEFLFRNPVHCLGVVLGAGICGGLAFTVAHELIHGVTRFEAFLVDVLLCLFCYMHYSASHIAHHMKVGTMDDAGTGRLNESFYAFFPRAVFMSVRDGIWMERKRLQSHRQGLLTLHNRMWKWFLMPPVLFSSVYALFGPIALTFMCAQALVAVMALELVNYLEHYGLTRATLNGKLEPVSSKHSWNADWGFTSALVFNLQRHAHHHNHSTITYQALESLPDAPLMPMSYPGMMLTALIPPLYFHIMNPRIQCLQERMKA